MYVTEEVHSTISPAFVEALYRTVRIEKPNVAIEIGMAFGSSTLAILTAMEENGSGRLVSIDPNQNDPHQWNGAGLRHVAEAGLDHRHRLVEEPDFLALPDLVRRSEPVDFAYIDGWHTFDYVLVDFFYIDKLLRSGGMVGFNDCGWPAVEKALRYLPRHRRYTEEDVGLSPSWKYRSGKDRMRRKRVNGADRYFRKNEDWEPDFRFFADF
jgi:predicted O-methyltransferase YrrM